jgi:hypothetical protein
MCLVCDKDSYTKDNDKQLHLTSYHRMVGMLSGNFKVNHPPVLL